MPQIMLLNLTATYFSSLHLISQSLILTILIIVVVFFSILLCLGVRKSHKLKKENERLDKISEEMAKKSEDYKDFTSGHMYQ